jgi:hypothetical protein
VEIPQRLLEVRRSEHGSKALIGANRGQAIVAHEPVVGRVVAASSSKSRSRKRAPNVFPNGEVEIEIRKLMDVEDFGKGLRRIRKSRK